MMSFDRNATATEVVAGHDLSGKEVVVTGGYAGIGYETVRHWRSLAPASRLLAAQTGRRERLPLARRRSDTANDSIPAFRPLDLGSIASVTVWSRAHVDQGTPLHMLINNAGVMATPLQRTADGFESQFGINHLGHFALTLGLLPCLQAADAARVICLTSTAHRDGDIRYDDPNYEHRPYDPWEAYGQSKTCIALFAVALTLATRALPPTP